MSGHSVVRPSLPPLLWTAVGMWAGVALAEALAWRAFTAGSGVRPVVGVTMALAAVLLWTLVRRHAAAILLAGVCAGVLCGSLQCWSWMGDVRALDEHPPSRWSGEVISDASAGMFGESSTVRVKLGEQPISVRACWPKESRAPEAGEVCEFFGSYRAPSTDEYGRRQFRSGQVGSVSARRVIANGYARSLRGVVAPWRHRWLVKTQRVAGDGGALLDGVVLGARTRLAGTEAESAFRTTGLTHLVAVSGGHLVVVAALAMWVLTQLRVKRGVTTGVVLALTGLYVVVSGVQASAVRAWLMSAVLAASTVSGRRGDGVASLSGALWLALAIAPMAAFDLGLQLSVLSVAGLLLFARLAESWAGEASPPPLGKLASPVSLTLVAQAVTVPLTVATFGMLSLVSPLANLLVGPLVSLLLLQGIAGLALSYVWPVAGTFVLGTAGTVGGIAARVAMWLASWPHAAVPLGWSAPLASMAALGAAAMVWLIWPQPNRRRARLLAGAALAGLVAISVGPPAARGPEIIVFDVGQGDAILVRDGPSAVLVDTGPDETMLREALLRQKVRKLNAVVITHLHDDHYGGIGALEGVIPVGRVLVPEGTSGQRPDILEHFRRVSPVLEELIVGDTFGVGDFTLTTLWPREQVPDAATNEASIVLAVRCGAFDALLTGDAESRELSHVLDAGGLGDIEVFKVGHHGSADGADERVLGVLRPEYALISCGTGNRYGHPVPATVALLERTGSRVLRTDLHGDLRIRTDGKKFAVSTAESSR